MCAADAALGGVGELLAWIAKDAPGVRLVIEAMDEPAELKRRLRIGEVDFVADYARYDDEELIHDFVFQHELVAIARKGASAHQRSHHEEAVRRGAARDPHREARPG